VANPQAGGRGTTLCLAWVALPGAYTLASRAVWVTGGTQTFCP
jgi:hypothetical protein